MGKSTIHHTNDLSVRSVRFWWLSAMITSQVMLGIHQFDDHKMPQNFIIHRLPHRIVGREKVRAKVLAGLNTECVTSFYHDREGKSGQRRSFSCSAHTHAHDSSNNFTSSKKKRWKNASEREKKIRKLFLRGKAVDFFSEFRK